MKQEPWKIWIDTGGTFTDCFAISPEGNNKSLKLLSNATVRGKIKSQISKNEVEVEIEWPCTKDVYKDYSFLLSGEKQAYKVSAVNTSENSILLKGNSKKIKAGQHFSLTAFEEVPVMAIRLLTEMSLYDKVPKLELKLGSTRGTNALLERKGAKTVLLITKGFKDLLAIGNQQRPDLFAQQIIKPKPLYSAVIEVPERVDAQGNILTKLSKKDIQQIINFCGKKKAESIAIALLNAYKNPAHELMLKKYLHAAGFKYVSISSEQSSQIRLLPRAETTVANAYLKPIIDDYLHSIKTSLPGIDIKVMNSAGGLISSKFFTPKDSLLSGPAGGVIGSALKAALSNKDQIITFDMGGTSTDVSLYAQRPDYRYESKVADYSILSPSIAIETIAAGGGSICDFDGYKLTVGPESAGAYPGPACYGAGGPLTITDVNLLLGRLLPENFSIPIYADKAEEALNTLLLKMNRKMPKQRINQARLQLLESFIQIANEKMAEALRKVSIHKGIDARSFSLLSFGGAGGQHACALAEALNMQSIIVPYDAGLLSAWGIGNASTERFAERLVLEEYEKVKEKLPELIEQVRKTAEKLILQEGFSKHEIESGYISLFLRFRGQDSNIEIEGNSLMKVPGLFKEKYTEIYGHYPLGKALELESVRVKVKSASPVSGSHSNVVQKYKPNASAFTKWKRKGKQFRVPVYYWENLNAGAKISGPAMLLHKTSTTCIDEDWEFLLDFNNNGLLRQVGNTTQVTAKGFEEAELELFTNRFSAIANEMGVLLQRSSFSVNIKERLDFSCAVLDSKGYLVVNAPHVPVHLGSLGVCVREVLKKMKLRKGDVIITNHPAFGGSHLPDITLLSPVYYENECVAFVANRAHHAEVGGMRPGSMPANAKYLYEEGVIIAPTLFADSNKVYWEDVEKVFKEAKFPTRAWTENQADLNAALASIRLGVKQVQQLCQAHGKQQVKKYLRAIRQNAASLLSDKLLQLKNKNLSAKEYLDDGSCLSVHIHKKSASLFFDFTGTSKVHSGNLNASPAIVNSVILYVLRVWLNAPVPLNEGLMHKVKIELPICMLNPGSVEKYKHYPAVVGGNTEVSQRLTDTLFKAFQLMACSQGTMNNLLFGNDAFGYYETICGGTGAGQGFHGADAVHSNMTNTRITDPEILEWRYPVRLLEFSVRKNSGGKGKWRGGNGVLRVFEFLQDLELSMLSQHRKEKPFGLKSGQAGKVGMQYLISRQGHKQSLKGSFSIQVNQGEILQVLTPGGGGYGKLRSHR